LFYPFKIIFDRSLYFYVKTRNHLKIRIFVRDQGGTEDQPATILKYVEDLRQGLNADTGEKTFLGWLLNRSTQLPTVTMDA